MDNIQETGAFLAPLYAKIAIISGKIGAIAKDKKHAQGYDYHSADSIMGALNSLMAEHGLVIIPTSQAVGIEEGRYIIKYRYLICDAETGASIPAEWTGEAPLGITRKDNTIAPDDKAMGKAHTYAYKYWLMKLFMISTVDTDDLDTNHQEGVQASKPAPKQSKPSPTEPSAHFDTQWNEAEMKKFWYYWSRTKQLADETILKGLGVSKLSEWQGSYEAAKQRMNAYFESIK